MKWLVVHENGELTVHDTEEHEGTILSQLQGLVKNLIEFVRLPNHRDMVIDEEGAVREIARFYFPPTVLLFALVQPLCS